MAERTAEEWGRIAVSLPGWRWMPGMRWLLPAYATEPRAGRVYDETQAAWWNDPRSDVEGDSVPDPDDLATAGCLLALLGTTPSEGYMAHVLPPSSAVTKWRIHMNTAQTGPLSAYGATLGRACIDAAAALGRWPGGGTE